MDQVRDPCRWATCLLDGEPDALDTPDALRHERYGGAPGRVWGAKKQCEVSRAGAARRTLLAGGRSVLGEPDPLRDKLIYYVIQ